MDKLIETIQREIDTFMKSKISKYSDKQLEGFEKSRIAGQNAKQTNQTSDERKQDILNGMKWSEFQKKHKIKSGEVYYRLKKKLGV
jgi:hypothetical protein